MRAVRLTLMLLYLTLLDTASSIYPRIRLTHKGKKKKKKWEEICLSLTNKPGCDHILLLHSCCNNRSTHCSGFNSIYDSVGGFLAYLNQICTTLLSQSPSQQSVGGHRRLYSLTMATHTTCCFSRWTIFLPCNSVRLTTESQKRQTDNKQTEKQ